MTKPRIFTRSPQQPVVPATAVSSTAVGRTGAHALLRVLRERIESGPIVHYLNRLRQLQVWLVLGGATLLEMWLGFRFGDRFGLLIGFFLALTLNALVIFYDDWRLAAHFKGKDLEGADPFGVLQTTQALARTLKLPMPLVRELASPTPFLFSAGLVATRLRLYISTAAMKRLTPAELRSILARELMRFHTDQTRVATATAALADLALILSGALDAALFLRWLFPLVGRSAPHRSCPGPVTWLILPLISIFLRLVIHRKSVLAIDLLASEVFSCGEDLACALLKLDSYQKTLPIDVNFAEASLFIVDPLASREWSHWASIQPPIENRIRSLVGRFPL